MAVGWGAPVPVSQLVLAAPPLSRCRWRCPWHCHPTGWGAAMQVWPAGTVMRRAAMHRARSRSRAPDRSPETYKIWILAVSLEATDLRPPGLARGSPAGWAEASCGFDRRRAFWGRRQSDDKVPALPAPPDGRGPSISSDVAECAFHVCERFVLRSEVRSQEGGCAAESVDVIDWYYGTGT